MRGNERFAGAAAVRACDNGCAASRAFRRGGGQRSRHMRPRGRRASSGHPAWRSRAPIAAGVNSSRAASQPSTTENGIPACAGMSGWEVGLARLWLFRMRRSGIQFTIVYSPTLFPRFVAGMTALLVPATASAPHVEPSHRDPPRRRQPRRRAGAGRSDHHRGDPARAQLGGEPDEGGAGPHRLLAGDLRGARLRRRDLRPEDAPPRPGAEPADLHGHALLLRRRGGEGRRRRGQARSRRHPSLQLALRHRLASAGRGGGDAGLPRERS